jgi:hypothetical protein
MNILKNIALYSVTILFLLASFDKSDINTSQDESVSPSVKSAVSTLIVQPSKPHPLKFVQYKVTFFVQQPIIALLVASALLLNLKLFSYDIFKFLLRLRIKLIHCRTNYLGVLPPQN